jgi:hypothetical protein
LKNKKGNFGRFCCDSIPKTLLFHYNLAVPRGTALFLLIKPNPFDSKKDK